ncbi:MAG: hypothetical protein OXN84_08285, partial [Albidovulum sp.]|nr:hypothetical protein [Albidovulum sp.]
KSDQDGRKKLTGSGHLNFGTAKGSDKPLPPFLVFVDKPAEILGAQEYFANPIGAPLTDHH